MRKMTEEAKTYLKVYQREHKEELRLKRQQYRLTHKYARSKVSLRVHLKSKIEVLSHYSTNKEKPTCCSCGEDRLPCLSIDHLKDNGYLDKDSKGRKRGGRDFYAKLKREGFPDGYQTLCLNCQAIKADKFRNFLRLLRDAAEEVKKN